MGCTTCGGASSLVNVFKNGFRSSTKPIKTVKVHNELSLDIIGIRSQLLTIKVHEVKSIEFKVKLVGDYNVPQSELDKPYEQRRKFTKEELNNELEKVGAIHRFT